MKVFSYFWVIKWNMDRKDNEYEKDISSTIYILEYSGLVCTTIKAKQLHRFLQEGHPYKDGKGCGNDLWS